MTPRFRAPARRDLLFGALPGWWQRLFSTDAEIAGIAFERRRRGRAAWRYLHIHGDEMTARESLTAHLEQGRGEAFFVRSSARIVTIDGARIDPNRMFSRDGADRSLRRLNPGLRESQIANILLRLDREREDFLKEILPRRGGVLVALHNNARGYSMKTEEPISDRVSWKQPDQPHDFVLVTDPRDWEILAASPFNAVLQRNPPPPDDGSLSRICAARGFRYLNVETALGHLAEQQSILGWLYANLPERRE